MRWVVTQCVGCNRERLGLDISGARGATERAGAPRSATLLLPGCDPALPKGFAGCRARGARSVAAAAGVAEGDTLAIVGALCNVAAGHQPGARGGAALYDEGSARRRQAAVSSAADPSLTPTLVPSRNNPIFPWLAVHTHAALGDLQRPSEAKWSAAAQPPTFLGRTSMSKMAMGMARVATALGTSVRLCWGVGGRRRGGRRVERVAGRVGSSRKPPSEEAP